MSNKNKKIIVILGPTSSGKTKLAVKLAYKFNGEVISADSRQVYRGMDIGTGKDLQDYRFKFQIPNSKFQKINIPYHLIDIVNPRGEFNVAKFQKLAKKAIEDILKRKKIPIICGGTGLYLQALVDNYNFSKKKTDMKLRKELENKTLKQLFSILKKLNKQKALSLNNSEKNNKRRLIRLIEVLSYNAQRTTHNINNPPFIKGGGEDFKYLILGLQIPKPILDQKIYNRLIYRLEKQGLIDEVKKLHKEGLSWKKLESFGLEYKFVSQYLQRKLEYEEMIEKLNIAIRQFAKRQVTWFKRMEKMGDKINWIKNYNEADKLIKKFLN